jgi:hypothetical protein
MLVRKSKNMMTETEVYGCAVGTAIHGQDKFGAAQALVALTEIDNLVKDNECDATTANRVRAALGNQSAVVQHCRKHGLLRSPPDAKSTAVRKILDELDKKVLDLVK